MGSTDKLAILDVADLTLTGSNTNMIGGVLSPHSKKPPPPGSFSVWRLHALPVPVRVLSGISGFLPQFNTCVGGASELTSKLTSCVNVCMGVSPAMSWLPAGGQLGYPPTPTTGSC